MAARTRPRSPPRSRRARSPGKCFHLFPKIREVDALMTPAMQDRVAECHPEGAFWAMNSRQPLGEPKQVKSQPYAPGLALRRTLLERAGVSTDFLAAHRFRSSEAREDDFLDACACAWTARRVLLGEAIRFPENGDTLDPKGLRMEILA